MSTNLLDAPNRANASGAERTRRADALRRRRLSRRSLLAASARAGVGASALALVGCSGDDESAQPIDQQQGVPAGQPSQQAGSQVQQAQPGQQSAPAQPQADPAPDQPAPGGIIRLWLPVGRHDRWDPHRSRFRYTQAMHSLIYNRLLRPASMRTGELEADLAAPPETPDELTYVFTIEPNAVFWNLAPTDGRAVTAEDVRWNIERQREALDAAGLSDWHFFRRAAYQRTAAIEVEGERTIRLTTAAPESTYLASVHASPFAWITSPEAAELYADDWRDDPADAMRNSGSGPYTPRQYSGAEFALARSENWWRPDSARADGVILVSTDAAAIGSLYVSSAIDAAGFPLDNETVELLREEHPEHPVYEVPLDAGVELLAPLSGEAESPLADPRVLRACAIAVDRGALAERLYGEHGRPSGPLPWFLDGWSLPETALAQFAGTRGDREADLTEAAQLVSAAGGADALAPIPLVVADLFEGRFPGAGEAVRGMIADGAGLEVEREYRPLADALDQLREGDRFLMLGWGAALQQADPTDEWASVLHSEGEQHWSGGADPELDALIDQMRTTFDRAERQALAHRVQERLLSGESHQWRVALARGVQLGVHQPWFQPDPRLFEYGWSFDRLSESGLDTAADGYPVERELPAPPEEPSEDDAGG